MESQIVPNYLSDNESVQSDSELSENENYPPRKRSRREVIYENVQKMCSSEEEAHQILKKQQLWKQKSTSPSVEGVRILYLCKYSSKCASRMCIFKQASSKAETAETIASRWSLERDPTDPSSKVFAKEPKLTTALQTNAYSIARSTDVQIKLRTIDSEKYYFIPSTESNFKPITESEVNSYLKKPKYKSFDSLISFKSRMWIVHYNSNSWLQSSCTCPPFTKEYVCKHIMAIAIINKDFSVKDEAKSSSPILKRKRAKGRPKKATKALIVD